MVDLAVFRIVETESFSPAEDQKVDEKIVGRERSASPCRAHGNQDCSAAKFAEAKDMKPARKVLQRRARSVVEIDVSRSI